MGELPPVSDHVKNILAPNVELMMRCEDELKKLEVTFSVEKMEVDDLNKSKNIWKSTQKQPQQDTDVSSFMKMISSASVNIGSNEPAKDFAKLLQNAVEVGCSTNAIFDQLIARVREFVNDALVKHHTRKIVECLQVMKTEACKKHQVERVNNFLLEFKQNLESEGKMSVWESLFVDHSIGLISKFKIRTEILRKEKSVTGPMFNFKLYF